MFLLNGTAGTESCRTARLSDGDQVVWFYTDDYTRDYGSESWSSASGTGSAGTVITVTAASPAVTARQAAQAAAALPASGGSITVSAPGCTAVSLPVKTAGELAAKTGAGWTAVLSGGRVTLPAKALQALAAQASGDELTLFVHKESASVFQVKLTCGGREIKDLGRCRPDGGAAGGRRFQRGPELPRGGADGLRQNELRHRQRGEHRRRGLRAPFPDPVRPGDDNRRGAGRRALPGYRGALGGAVRQRDLCPGRAGRRIPDGLRP
jgi:hypothetical protein